MTIKKGAIVEHPIFGQACVLSIRNQNIVVRFKKKNCILTYPLNLFLSVFKIDGSSQSNSRPAVKRNSRGSAWKTDIVRSNSFYSVGDYVRHPRYGVGIVKGIRKSDVYVEFKVEDKMSYGNSNAKCRKLVIYQQLESQPPKVSLYNTPPRHHSTSIRPVNLGRRCWN